MKSGLKLSPLRFACLGDGSFADSRASSSERMKLKQDALLNAMNEGDETIADDIQALRLDESEDNVQLIEQQQYIRNLALIKEQKAKLINLEALLRDRTGTKLQTHPLVVGFHKYKELKVQENRDKLRIFAA